MIVELNIKNLAIIENIRINFATGMTALSGEEGSGKSLIIDSLGILMGTRTPAKLIRNGKTQATIEGVFSISPKTERILKKYFEEIDIELESDGTLVITRDLHQQGRSISRINGRAVPQSLVRKISTHLMDIHGQLDYISILDSHHQTNMLDSYGNLLELRNELSEMVDQYKCKLRELSAINTSRTDGRIELLKYQAAEIEKANLQPGEEEELQQKLDILQNAETLKDSCLKVYSNLYGDDQSATVLLSEALSLLKNMRQHDAKFNILDEQINEYMSNIEDISTEFRNYADKLEIDVDELNEIELRLNLLNTLKRKYGNTIDDIIKFYNNVLRELEVIENTGQHKNDLIESINNFEQQIAVMADKLSQGRLTNAKLLSNLVNQELEDVGLSLSKFDISVIQDESKDGLLMPSGKKIAFTREGIDRVEFMISTNPGEPIRPLKTIVSGGETSRIMLALKSALKKVDPVPTLVFDEIDAGVGGRSGDNIGRKLLSISRQHQVICITHLPQIACFADSHIKITKDIKSGRVSTNIQVVDGENRIEELAAMLGANSAGKTMLKGAEKLLDNASLWKTKEKGKCVSVS